MPGAVEQTRSGLTFGVFGLGLRGDQVGSVAQQVHDGDTVSVRALGNFGVRFLGIDAPEVSFQLPGSQAFTSISHPEWDAFLSDPFADTYDPFDPPLEPGLKTYLEAHVGAGTANNHARYAEAAHRELERLVSADMDDLGASKDEFGFFLAFAFEIMDGYGRLLCFVNRDQEDEPRPNSYNERLLEAGVVSPYFIWPNIDPFRKARSVSQAVIAPGQASAVAEATPKLRDARQWVQSARQSGQGLYDQQDPLRLQPFELRSLARRRPPDRWLIDLSRSDDVLVQPQAYHTVPNVEDRLFIPDQYVPLFVEAGWQRQT